jgi:hypothetical protein
MNTTWPLQYHLVYQAARGHNPSISMKKYSVIGRPVQVG